jgi:translation initiation factor IF-2
LLVQNGTLRRGDVVVAGLSHGRIKTMFDERGREVKEAGPSLPVSVMGLDITPEAGDRFEVVQNIKLARNIVAEHHEEMGDEEGGAAAEAMTLEAFFQRMQEAEHKELLLIIKVDVHGSLEPVINSLNNLSTDEVDVRILHSDVGNISENDVNLASASGAIIIGFNTQVDNAAERAAASVGVDIRTYNIIYKMIEDIEKALRGMLDPVYEDRVIGVAEVRAVFKISRLGQVAGCYVRDGVARRNAKARVIRNGRAITDNLNVASLKRFEEDVREVRTGFECGVGLEKFSGFEERDYIEFVVRERVE